MTRRVQDDGAIMPVAPDNMEAAGFGSAAYDFVILQRAPPMGHDPSHVGLIAVNLQQPIDDQGGYHESSGPVWPVAARRVGCLAMEREKPVGNLSDDGECDKPA